jgi:creatinine amidohydrolase/Fe(II)-dependent formamide hydrolase-like protein
MLYLMPELVRNDKRMSVPVKEKDKYPGIVKYPYYKDLTDYGTLGDALCASEEKGRVTVERAVDTIVSFIKEELEKD